ncbi:glycerophosphodiester phosphodiesterase GDPDL7-like [Hordeum vulgare subsp. vulgare]|uniref:glycerophosphodiester phosphodiesterase n=1 Tax=Hordeum vulgare subsp. vulgare TaxID=112509 RepID=A0A8I6YIS8_HORVV|nr:glycerophosphodiester phosphodiesterase GDPDL7-like [Hordeum vulgare subsp. vulgare]XP_044955544.1 glycerophosphodiester phosphodiesterase GDPDL7-like [Hordeum vulgare subsp. vulgare]
MGGRYPHMLLILILLHGANAAIDEAPVEKWLTLDGRPPLVTARGGFSGLFPEASKFAYEFAMTASLPGVCLQCDLQLSSDSVGFCRSGLTLDKSTLIAEVYPKKDKTYRVGTDDVHGWFAVDFTSDELINNVTVIQTIFSRPSTFDAMMGMYTLDDVAGLRPEQIWINVEFHGFYKDHNLDIEDYLLKLPKDYPIAYISSPDIAFLKSVGGKLKGRAKLILRCLQDNVTEPSIRKSYGDILKDLKSVKDFASGILVARSHIWPVNNNLYLLPSTSLVKDAHALGLEVHVGGFSNDILTSYNYSYDPAQEYLQFIDNHDFNVDGVMTDFPPTASGVVACLAHNERNDLASTANAERPLIITHNGASGVYAGCTDLAYQQAVKDGADIIDCSVRMSKDGVAFCMGSADLIASTTAATTFMTKVVTVSEIQNKSGIFSFDLSWSEIQTLKPELGGPFAQAGLKRNPAAKNAGKFFTLPEFLDFAKTSNVSGILIEIEDAPFLATRGLGLVDAVSGALVNASYDKESKQQVFIESDDSAVLSAFKKFPTFKRVLTVSTIISDASKPAVDDIKKFADVVMVTRGALVKVNGFFLTGFTNLVENLHAANLTVHVGVLRNEFTNFGFDYFADPMIEIATYSAALVVDGLVTEFPHTATTYFRSPCSDPTKNLTYTIMAASPGALVSMVSPGALPPAFPPAPVLEPADVLDPPLPPVSLSSPPEAAPKVADSSSSPPSSSAGNCFLVAAGIAALLYSSFH